MYLAENDVKGVPQSTGRYLLRNEYILHLPMKYIFVCSFSIYETAFGDIFVFQPSLLAACSIVTYFLCNLW
ncbi:hypothetical protein B5F71_10715 [Bacteroides sp. An269]|nr:hypothetical protein B5F71_10715 [Bacteroides sp. An269]